MESMSLFFAQTQLGLLTSFLHMFAGLALGLSWMLVVYDRGGSARDSDSFRFWLRVFALTVYSTLALGLMTMVQTGLVLPQAPLQMGNVLGPLLLAVVFTAYVTKSTTFGVVLYSRHRVTKTVYRMSLFLTALGVTVVVAGLAIIDSWMRAPAGAILLDGQFRIHDWFEVVGNPQLTFQLLYVALTAVLMLSSVVVCAWAQRVRTGVVDAGFGQWARFLTILGVLVTLAVLPMAQQAVAQVFAQSADFPAILAGKLVASASQQAATQCARLLLLFWILHVMVMLLAVAQMFRRADQGRASESLVHRAWVTKLLTVAAFTGPLVCLTLWWLIYLGKGPDMVVGALPMFDLLTQVPAQYLFLGVILSTAVVVLVFLGWFLLAYQALADGVTTVHRPGVVLS